MNHHFDCICFLVSKEILKKDKHELAWIKLLKKVTAHNKEWSSCSNDRVCSEHLVDCKPTVENPNPTLKLGSELTQKKSLCLHYRHHHYHVQTFLHQYQIIVIIQETILLNANHAITRTF